MSTHLGKRAVVVGAGIGGLSAAGALSEFFDEVVVLENDRYTEGVGPRPGTPQSKHTHALLAGGYKALSDLFPFFEEAVRNAGAIPLRESSDIRRERPGYDPLPQRDLGMTVFSMSRPLLESVVRSQVERLGNVEVRADCKARGFATQRTDRSLTCVRFETSGGPTDQLHADFFVDATGHGRLTLQFLDFMGDPAPNETVVGVDVGYATTIFERPKDPPGDWKATMTYANPPVNRRSSYIFPIEGDLWIVTNTGRYDDKPPGTEAGFIAHLQGLRTRTAYEALKSAKRCGPIAQNIFKANRRKSFLGSLRSFANLIPFGDAICRFNPIYGQGMSVAAMEASLLKSIMKAKVTDGGRLDAIAPEFLSGVEALLDAPWNMAVIPDFVDPLTEGNPPTDLRQSLRFSAAVLKLASEDIEINRLLLEVQHMLKPRSAYRDPQILGRIQPILQSMTT